MPNPELQQHPDTQRARYARRQSRFSPRYFPVDLTLAATEDTAAPVTEVDSSADNQLKIQVVLAMAIMTLFAAGFLVVICLLLLKPPPSGYLLLEPRSPFGGPRVEINPANTEAFSMLLSRLGHQLSHASVRVWRPLLSRGHRRPRDCAREQRYPADGEICVPSVAAFGPCNAYTAFGYARGDPCILVKAGPQLSSNYSENPRISCSVSGANLSLAYYPTMRYLAQSFTYFPRYFFPYVPDSPFYLPPLAMVQLRRPPRNVPISITCRLDNEALRNVSTSARLQLLFK